MFATCNCVPQWQLFSCATTKPSLWKVCVLVQLQLIITGLLTSFHWPALMYLCMQAWTSHFLPRKAALDFIQRHPLCQICFEPRDQTRKLQEYVQSDACHGCPNPMVAIKVEASWRQCLFAQLYFKYCSYGQLQPSCTCHQSYSGFVFGFKWQNAGRGLGTRLGYM